MIAIIGLLASVVQAAMGNARQQAKKAAIIAGLEQARTQSVIYYNNHGDYINLCDNQKMQAIVDSLEAIGKGATCWESVGGAYIAKGSYGYIQSASFMANINFGVGVVYNGNYYATDAFGVGVLDSKNLHYNGHTTFNWYEAKAGCAAKGERLPSYSFVATFFASPIYGSNMMDKFFANYGTYFWTSTENPKDPSKAYGIYTAGYVWNSDKGNPFGGGYSVHVRCVDPA